MSIAFRPPIEEDAALLAPRLRAADKAELSAISNRSYGVTLRLSIVTSDEPMAVVQDNQLIAVFGVGRASVMSTTGVPWLLGSDPLDRLPRTLLPLSRAVITHWRQKYPVMINHVSADHHKSIRWLKWLGFTVHPAEPFGQFGNPFHKFEMRSDHV